MMRHSLLVCGEVNVPISIMIRLSNWGIANTQEKYGRKLVF